MAEAGFVQYLLRGILHRLVLVILHFPPTLILNYFLGVRVGFSLPKTSDDDNLLSFSSIVLAHHECIIYYKR